MAKVTAVPRKAQPLTVLGVHVDRGQQGHGREHGRDPAPHGALGEADPQQQDDREAGREEPDPVARARASRRISPSVLRAMKSAPWVRQRSRTTMPPRRDIGLSRVKKLPANSMSASIGEAAHQVGERDADEQRGDDRADGDAQVPVAPPGVVVALAAVLRPMARTMSATRTSRSGGTSPRTSSRTSAGRPRRSRHRR